MLLYESTDVTLKRFTWRIVDSNAYLLLKGKHGLLIDVVDDEALYDEVSPLEDLTVIVTHSHFDHIYGLNKLREFFPATRVISTKKCSENMGNHYRNMSASATAYLAFYQGGAKSNIEFAPFTCAPSDETFEGGTELSWNGIDVKLKSCYGHSNDSLIVQIDERWLFSGDTLLNIPTITRFIGGSTRGFWEVDIPYLKSLAGEAETVFPGHGDSGKLSDMIAVNLKNRPSRMR